jgi:hypothetical protein
MPKADRFDRKCQRIHPNTTQKNPTSAAIFAPGAAAAVDIVALMDRRI